LRVEVPRESPVVFFDGAEMSLWGSTQTFDFVIQRTQFWPQLKSRSFFMIPHVPRLHSYTEG